jgi:hypothetical protein
MAPKVIRQHFDAQGMKLDGISSHCPHWVHTTAWTKSPTIRPFTPETVWKKGEEYTEKWAEDYLLAFYQLLADLGVPITAMFWGVAQGWDLATGYPWGFWKWQ